MKIITWNINGYRSADKLGKIDELISKNKPDIICLQEIKMNDEVAKVFGEKAGFMKKQVVPLPANLLGPISDNVTLKEEITNFDDLRANMRSERSF
jgi:hypothetical protein